MESSLVQEPEKYFKWKISKKSLFLKKNKAVYIFFIAIHLIEKTKKADDCKTYLAKKSYFLIAGLQKSKETAGF
jgi:hypothetical protein